MIFKSLHENLVKKKINKSLELLNNQIRIKPNPIKTIGCIIDPMFPVEVNNFIKLVYKIGLKENTGNSLHKRTKYRNNCKNKKN